MNKLYLTGNNDERQIGWEYCLTIEHYCTFNEADIFMYVTDVPRNGGEIIMSNQLEGDLRFETTFILDYEMDPGNSVKQVLPYKLNIYDSYGNMVLMMQDHMGAFLFLKYGHTDPIGWSLANNPIISSSTFLEFAEEWIEEPSYGLYEVVFGTYTLPVTFKKSQYLYYLNVEEWYSTMRAAGLHDDDHIDLRQLVKLMRHHADSDFWSDEALRAFHLQFLMEFIQPRYIQAPDVVIID